MFYGVYDNTDSLQLEFFKFCFFSFIQKKVDDIKDYHNYPISQSAQSDRNLSQHAYRLFSNSVSDFNRYLFKYDNRIFI